MLSSEQTRGGKNRMSVLEEWQLYSIRSEYKEGVSVENLAKDYGIGEAHVKQILRGRVWVHLDLDDIYVREHPQKGKTMHSHKCKGCGKEFESVHRIRVYCGRDCRDDARRKIK